MKRSVLLVVVTAALVAPTAAQARTWVVWAGAPTNPPADVRDSMPWLNQFLPSKLQIHVGDKVTFKTKEFHTATFLGSTPASQIPLLMPDLNSHYSGINDAQGVPFWFNGGPPKFIYNPQAFQTIGSSVVADKNVHSSGVLAFRPGHQYTFTFKKAGTYRYICLVHTHMKGTIVVKPTRAKIPSKAKVAAAVLKRLNQSWAAARKLQTQLPTEPNTVYAGVGISPVLQAFLPRTLTVPAGTTVTWIAKAHDEIHNVALGDPGYITSLDESVDQFPVAPGAPSQVNPFLIYGSEPPGAPYVYTGTNHGNGFLATPAIDIDPNTPNGDRVSVKFTTPGRYHYICMVHGKDMWGEIVVT